jgi:hypothetical protein
MGRVSFHSGTRVLHADCPKVFGFLSNLDNMEGLMPEQVVNWRSDEKSCSFDIKGMAHIHLRLAEVVKNKVVTIVSGQDNPIDLKLQFDLAEAESNRCHGTVTLEAELSMMLQMMASTPLQNLVNIIGDKLQEVFR